MPADFEREVTEHLSLLRGDLEQVSWRDEAAVRKRGARRQMRRAASTGLAVVASVGVIGYGAVVSMPGDPVTLANPFLAASPSDPDKAPAPSGRQRSQSPTETGAEPPAGWPFDPDPPVPRSQLPDQPNSGQPSTPNPDPASTSPVTSPSDTPTPTSSDSPGVSPTQPELTANALLVDLEMPKVNDSANTWAATGTSDGEGATPASACQSGDLASLGATSAVRRNFDWGTDGTVTGVNVVGAFGSGADATAAYNTYSSWLEGCTWGTPHGPTDVSVSAGAATWWWFGRDNGDSTGEIEAVGLVRTGALVSVVVWHENSQDFIYDTDPMAPVLQASADRLAP
jgi:hypothetical protein